jgi:hypothetical protein
MIVAEALRDNVSLQWMCQDNYSGLVLMFPFCLYNNMINWLVEVWNAPPTKFCLFIIHEFQNETPPTLFAKALIKQQMPAISTYNNYLDFETPRVGSIVSLKLFYRLL